MKLIEVGSSSEDSSLEYIGEDVSELCFDDVYSYTSHFKKVCIHKTIFYASDLKTLLPGRWLNDKIINFYFELLGRFHKQSYYFSTFVYPMIIEKSTEELAELFSTVDFSRYRSFFVPIHADSHWSLVKIQDNLLIGYDSMAEVAYGKILKIKEFYANVILERSNENVGFYLRHTRGKIPRQSNGDDCGVFCCAYAKYYAADDSNYFCFSTHDIPRIRRQMLHEILSGRILYYGEALPHSKPSTGT
ncbi:uncharacterized protein VICG_01593 [Vittaforma corneae ATCC 50505]|uniref:Ubiquitin-like protease family profile domain-containing protein n=1 Tax=Vittaforma corneae (strain ATCC 50505) TaxID=993615 RepID=L2GKE4_VITCO|nr:uncharacterized protein VICG_01593 [Vittaforma corneae ATCC 50505]ELA41353.1 hypothetical protein VICG_01593 [Vittaforma corneae ATCC 50505]